MRRTKNGYKRLYSTKHRSRGTGAVKAVVVVILMAALVFVGYSIWPTLSDLASGKVRHTTSSHTTSKANHTSSTTSNTSSKTTSQTSSDTSSQTTNVSAKIKGCYLPKSYLSDITSLEKFIQQAKAAGINLAVIDLKGEDGIVNYATALKEAKGTSIVAENAPDAAKAAKLLSEAGITPAARICAFKDPVAPLVIVNSGVIYSKNHSYRWIDSYKKNWLNPYSTVAQSYIEDLSTEAVSLGYKQVFVDDLIYPTNGWPDSSGYYGENMPSKESVIKSFVVTLKQKVGAAGGKLTVMTTGDTAIGQPQDNIGQLKNIFSYSSDYISPNLCPSLFTKTGITVGKTTVTKPDLTPGNTVSTITQYLKTQYDDKVSSAVPFIQSYTNTSLGDGYYKEYSSSDVKAEISAVTSNGFGGFILYNPEGNYDFSALE